MITSIGYGAAADWWSLGVLLCQCLTLSAPYADPHCRAQETFSNVVSGTCTMGVHYRRRLQ